MRIDEMRLNEHAQAAYTHVYVQCTYIFNFCKNVYRYSYDKKDLHCTLNCDHEICQTCKSKGRRTRISCTLILDKHTHV
jgi:hypothetical protein